MSCWAVIVAAGRGTRSGLSENKVFHPVAGRAVLSRCLDAFERCGRFEGVVLVLSENDRAAWTALEAREGPFPLVKAVAMGGATRRESVYHGLLAVPGDAEIVAIHDAARPFVSRDVIDATLESARAYGSGVISTPVVDTVKQIGSDGRVTSLDRASLRAVQTPQTFDYHKILEAHRRAEAEQLSVTDDAALFEHYYGNVRLATAAGAEENRKLTTKADFEALNEREGIDVRVGQGYDAHRLAEGRRLVLCGVEIPWEKGLDGHSDADVAVHALMDALLGALGLGDIGRLFPDNDPRYEGADSMKLLEDVMARVRERGYRVGNADVTIVAQRPKLASYMPDMRRRVADGLGVDMDRVNVKATTTERMGFEGEGTGISAQAVVLLKKRLAF
ncbi:MAG: 2-C-methyl-D-erythritol 2,4-cyclodiphosphate synthase [Clostridia bacterium]|nr:2-C-methyl-D-erythritol 2,4-cyclodiphosphate synthase [Clostridia bacterium]